MVEDVEDEGERESLGDRRVILSGPTPICYPQMSLNLICSISQHNDALAEASDRALSDVGKIRHVYHAVHPFQIHDYNLPHQ